jgi:hypothetical protein
MANRLTSETHYISLKEKDKSHAHTKRLYFNRALGCDCYYCIIDGHSNAGIEKGERTGPICGVPGKPEGFHICRSNVRP